MTDPTPEALAAAKRMLSIVSVEPMCNGFSRCCCCGDGPFANQEQWRRHNCIDDEFIARIIDEAIEPLRRALDECRVAARIANPEFRIEQIDKIVNTALQKGTPDEPNPQPPSGKE